MRTPAWPIEVANELLLILRSRLDQATILGATSFLRFTGFYQPNLDNDVAEIVEKAILRAIESLPEDQRHPILLMTGRNPTTKGSRVTRTEILEKMAEVIPRKRRIQLATPLSSRQVETIEEEEFVPAVLKALGSTSRLVPIYGDATVRISLSKGSTAATLRMSVELSAQVESSHWIVGVTPDELVADQICGMTGLVNEMICPGPSRKNADSVAFTLAIHDSSRKKLRPTPREMERVSPAELALMVSDHRIAEFDDVDWYAAGIPVNEAHEPMKITFTNSQEIDYRARYCYWSAGRRMYLRSITVDARTFPRRTQHYFSLQPFLMLPVVTSGLESTSYWELEADSWIEPGNGIAFIWGDAGNALK